MSTDAVDPFTELLGVYALDAVDDDERDAIDLHLRECPRCRAEVAEHREVASYLSRTGGAAPEGVWDRIAAELSPEAPPMRLSVLPPTTAAPPAAVRADVASLADRRARGVVRRRTLATAIASAAVIVAVLGVVTVLQYQRMGRLETAVQDVSLDKRATVVASGSGLQVHLQGVHGTAQAVVSDQGEGYLITKDLPTPAAGTVYQFWGQVDDKVLSLGTFGGRSTVVPFTLDARRLGGVQSFSVTQELAPGVVASTNPPVVAGTV